jgi:hypothetical protein
MTQRTVVHVLKANGSEPGSVSALPLAQMWTDCGCEDREINAELRGSPDSLRGSLPCIGETRG